MSKTADEFEFLGRKFTAEEIELVVAVVEPLKNLSRKEIAFTVCETINWKTTSKKLKVVPCQQLLEKLSEQGIIRLPEKVHSRTCIQKPITFTSMTDPKKEISGRVDDFKISLELVEATEDVTFWKELMERYHDLGYKKPFASHLKYFVKANDQVVACFLFGHASWSLADRDNWIGWTTQQRTKNLNLVINNNRFLMLPWVKIENLASKALSLALKSVGDDWKKKHGVAPVLVETFVDSRTQKGTSYQASNWIHVGQTTGRGRNDTHQQNDLGKKEIYVYPLAENFKDTLTNKKRKSSRPVKISGECVALLQGLWEQVGEVLREVSSTYDEKWQQRKRVLNTLVLCLIIYRMVFSKNSQGYNTTLLEFWANCQKAGIPMPQKKAIAASALTEARKKLNPQVFLDINDRVISKYEQTFSGHLWCDLRVFAVDGSKLNLPYKLAESGYREPGINCAPQGLVSVLYEIAPKIPFDFLLVNSESEREAVVHHISKLPKNSVVVYDRGYFSYDLWLAHIEKGINAVFRMSSGCSSEILKFGYSDQTDQVVTIKLPVDTLRKIKKKHTNFDASEIKIRLIKYTIQDTTYCLATTLLCNDKYPAELFPDIYHSRWGVEELYKISKSHFEVEDFHSKHETGIKQELYAHFSLITMNRIFSNEIENTFKENMDKSGIGKKVVQVNFKHQLHFFGEKLEELFLDTTLKVKKTVDSMIDACKAAYRRTRPNRSYERVSRKPVKKWTNSKNSTKSKERFERNHWPSPVLQL
jgi:hypothetical protein